MERIAAVRDHLNAGKQVTEKNKRCLMFDKYDKYYIHVLQADVMCLD